MIRIVLPDEKVRRLTFFLAMEEWAASHLEPAEYFFIWDVNPTVIIGHNQDLAAEVNLRYCAAHGIDIVRRLSGGGCVYADRDNIMMSYICPDTDVSAVFARYTAMVAAQLRAMGFDAEPSGRNDITIGTRKISGNAYYLTADRSIVHGTMLFDTDTSHMLNAITPSQAKLESHKVKSVEARIVTARQLRPDMDLDTFRRGLVSGLETDRYVMTENDLAAVARIESRYLDPAWLNEGRRGHHKTNN